MLGLRGIFAGRARVAVVAALLAVTPAAGQTDPLPSWNEGGVKAAIIGFVARVTSKGSPDYVPISERVAVFDNDGTLAVEQPMPAQVAFELDCINIGRPGHPEWATLQPFKAALEKDAAFLAQAGEKGFAKIMVASHAGWTSDDYETTLSSWLAQTRHQRFKRPYTELAYRPMLELLSYLQANGFETYIVSGYGRDFMRPWATKVYGVAPDRVLGSSIKTKFGIINGVPTFTRVPEIEFIGEREGRPAGIRDQTGRRPIAAFGNSDADLEMLQWVAMARRANLAVVVRHTDAEREYAYDRHAEFGKLDRLLDVARENGWPIVDMKKDWKTIFPFEQR